MTYVVEYLEFDGYPQGRWCLHVRTTFKDVADREVTLLRRDGYRVLVNGQEVDDEGGGK